MKLIIMGAALAYCSIAAAEYNQIFGHAWRGETEFEIYDNTTWCILTDKTARDVSRYKKGERWTYVTGCWKPIGDGRIRMTFQDGVVVEIQRSEIKVGPKYAPKISI